MYTNNFKLIQQKEHIIVLELIFDLCEGGFLSNKYYETGSLKNTETTSCTLYNQILSSIVLEKLRIETETKAIDKISKK